MSYFLNTYELDEVFPMTETVSLRFTLDEEFPVDEYFGDDTFQAIIKQDNDTYHAIVKDVDETLIESMNPDDLAEFFGIESEFVIAVEVIQ
jgi:hypothetical protein